MDIFGVKEEILNKTDIVDIISQYTKLKQDGRKYKGLSPFTLEKTPSFYVSPDKGVFYCFSSHQGGDIFTFIQKMEGVDFVGAIKIIAQKIGIDFNKFEYKKKESDKNSKELSKILENALFLYKGQINKEILDYLKSRGINQKIIDEWEIGFAPNLFDFCIKKINSTKELLSKVGLISLKEDKAYDRFRNRVLFPLRDINEKLVGFAGRIYVEAKNQPKYINSPETELYHKSTFLYGLSKAKNYIRKYNFSILTEGYLDTIMSHTTKFKNTIASSGTGVTKEHLQILKKISNKIVIAFDGDASGTLAAIKTSKIALEMSMDVKVLDLDNNRDPADIILENKENWYEKIKNAKTIIEFLLQKIQKNTKNETDMIVQVQEHVIPLIAIIENSMLKEKYIQNVSSFCNVSCDSIKKRIEMYSVDDEYERNISLHYVKNHSNDDKLLNEINEFVNYAEEKKIPFSKNTKKLLKELEECNPVAHNKSKVSEFLFEISKNTNNFNIDLEIFKNSKRFLLNHYKKVLGLMSVEKDWTDLTKIDKLNKKWENIQQNTSLCAF